MANKQKIQATAYLRTSSATNTGTDKDSEKRQRAAISKFAKANGYAIAEGDFFYDPAISGSDPLGSRPGFKALLARIAGNGVRVVIVEDASRFARNVMVQEQGIVELMQLGVKVFTANGEELTSENAENTMIRQILGSFAQFEKTKLVAKLKAARDRKKAENGKCGGRKTYSELDAAMVAKAHDLNDGRSLREIAAGLAAAGFVSRKGNVFAATSIKNMLGDEFKGAALKRTTARGKRILAA